MKIIVCIKQVPDTDEFRINPETGALLRAGNLSMNPDDKNVLEEALRIKENQGAEVITVTMGPMQAKDVLKESIAMGADRAVLLSDLSFAGSDTRATASILASAIKKIGNYDVIFCGAQTMDGNTGQVGPELAEILNIPQVIHVCEVKVKENEKQYELETVKLTEDKKYKLKIKTPVLLTGSSELNDPRIPTMKGIMEAYSEKGEGKTEVWSGKELDVDPAKVGWSGSSVKVSKFYLASGTKTPEIIDGKDSEEKAERLIRKLLESNLIQ